MYLPGQKFWTICVLPKSAVSELNGYLQFFVVLNPLIICSETN